MTALQTDHGATRRRTVVWSLLHLAGVAVFAALIVARMAHAGDAPTPPIHAAPLTGEISAPHMPAPR